MSIKGSDISVVPSPDNGGGDTKPDIQAEMGLLVIGIQDEAQRNSVLNALFDFSKGHPDGFSVKFAALIKALTLMIGNIPLLVKKSFAGESTKLQSNLISYQTAMGEAARDVSNAGKQMRAVSDQQMTALETAISTMEQSRKDDMAKMERQLAELRSAMPDVYKAAAIVKERDRATFWAAIGWTALGAMLLTLVIEHFVFHF